MQNIGFVYSLLPGLKKLFPDDINRAAGKYLPFFNTHPYMAPTVIGVFLNLEENGETETIDKIKNTIPNTLAAIGDSFYWATVKPIFSLLVLFSIILDRFLGIFLMLLLYNSAHLWVMIRGFHRAYSSGLAGALEIGRVLSIDRSKQLSSTIPLAAGMVLAALPGWHSMSMGKSYLFNIAFFIAAIAAIKLKVGIFWIFYGVFALILIWTVIL